MLQIISGKLFRPKSNKIDIDQFPRGIYFFVIKMLRKLAPREVYKNRPEAFYKKMIKIARCVSKQNKKNKVNGVYLRSFFREAVFY